MKRILILYDTQFGNTKRVAQEIASAIQIDENITTTVTTGHDPEVENVSGYDAVLFGGPTRAFRATRGALNSIKRAAKAGLDGKVVACFGTYLVGDTSRGVKAMDKLLSKAAQGAYHIKPGFSARVDGVRGPLNDKVIPDIPKFAKAIVDEIHDHAN
jgi:flavodoxin